MSNEKVLIPELRFPEFEGDGEWEKKVFEELFKIGNGRDYKHLDEGDIPVYGSGGYMLSVDDYLYDGESACIGRKGTIDNPMFLTGKFWTVDTLFYTYSFKDSIPKYIYYLFQSVKWLKHNEAGGVPSLSKANIYRIETLIPKLREQQKIADCLSSLDELITAHNDKLEALKNHKKGLLQNLFPQEGEKTPKVRFPEFENDGEWVAETLGNMCHKIMVGIASAATHAYRRSGIVLFRNQNIKEGYLDDEDILFIDEEYEKTHRNKRLKAGDLLTARTGYPGTTCVVPKKYEGSQSFTTLITRPDNSIINSQFLCLFINSEKGQVFFEATKIGGGQKNVNAGSLTEMPILFPSKEEQRKIASFLSKVDKLISEQVEKIEQLQHHKKGLMQGLFPKVEG